MLIIPELDVVGGALVVVVAITGSKNYLGVESDQSFALK